VRFVVVSAAQCVLYTLISWAAPNVTDAKPSEPTAHPGEFIREQVIEPLDLSVSSAARILGVPRHALRDIVDGSVALSTRMALRIEMAFGTPMEKLLGMQMACDIAAEREKKAGINVKRYRPGFRPRKKLSTDIARWSPGIDAASFLPLCARVSAERLSAVWTWAATHADHPECRYAVWSIAGNHARGHADPVRTHGTIMRHLAVIAALFENLESRSLLDAPCPDLSAFHCDVTRAAMETGQPELQVLAYRILCARSEIERTATEDRHNLYTDIAKNIDSLKRKRKRDHDRYEVPPFDALLTEEERNYRPALEWAAAQPAESEARSLFRKIRRRIESLAASQKAGSLLRNKDNQSYYVYKSGTLYVWYRKLARLYLEFGR
jgi:addiction module HigA family antidote